jgi:hypothetical protein
LNAKKSTQVISASAINSVLWPHRATIPTISILLELTLSAVHGLRRLRQIYEGGTLHFQGHAKLVAGHKNGYFQ